MFEWLNANQGVVDLVMTVLFIATSAVVIQSSFRANRIAESTLSQMREERRQETRPWVYFDIDVTNNYQTVNLRLLNKGRGAARNVQVHLDQDLQLSEDRKLSQTAILKPLGFLAPDGGAFSEYIGLAFRFFKQHEDVVLTGRVEYQGTDGHRYVTPVDISMKTYSQRSILLKKGVNDLIQAVDSLCEEMRRKL